MPTANSAVPAQPIQKTRSRYRRLALHVLGVVIGLALLVPAGAAAPQSVNAAASPACNGWNSSSHPPDQIRVLRVRTGRIESVPIRKYVVTVMGKEWPSYLPQAVVEAGAVAVKQYAWYHSMSPRRTDNGRCFDVRDSTGDQLYKPDKARIRSDHHRALDRTWGVHLIKDGRLFMTGYRRGNKGNCGRDATGWKLFARSATRCANSGKGYLEILRIYYGPGLNIVGGGGSGAAVTTSSTEAATASSGAGALSAFYGSGAPTGMDVPVAAATWPQLKLLSLSAWQDLFN